MTGFSGRLNELRAAACRKQLPRRKKKLESRKWWGQGFLELLNQLLGGDWNIDFIYFSIQLGMEHHPN